MQPSKCRFIVPFVYSLTRFTLPLSLQRKMITFQVYRVQVHLDAIDHFSRTHEVSYIGFIGYFFSFNFF